MIALHSGLAGSPRPYERRAESDNYFGQIGKKTGVLPKAGAVR